jgi:hypothetical protein
VAADLAVDHLHHREVQQEWVVDVK